jgi:hypothetical protein
VEAIEGMSNFRPAFAKYPFVEFVEKETQHRVLERQNAKAARA